MFRVTIFLLNSFLLLTEFVYCSGWKICQRIRQVTRQPQESVVQFQPANGTRY